MLTTALEAILFAAGKPLSLAFLKQALDASDETVRLAVEDLAKRFNTEASGIQVLQQEGKVQLVTNPAVGPQVAKALKQELSGELTRPSLEALTIIAYRGPITKPEIEQIRGVNCSLILRNLLMRGLIEEREDRQRLQNVYTASPDFLRHLGVHQLSELPDYQALHQNEKMDAMLQQLRASAPADPLV